MKSFPFLSQFKSIRKDDNFVKSITIEYDDSKDFNLLKDNNSLISLTITKTSVKNEADDFENDNEKVFTYLNAKSLTDVKAEKPDEIDDLLYLQLIATETFTKTKNESSDVNQ